MFDHLLEATKCWAAPCKRKTTWLDRMVWQFSAHDMAQVSNTKGGSMSTNLQLLSPWQGPLQQSIQAPTFSVIKNKSWWFNYYLMFQLNWSLTIEEHTVSPLSNHKDNNKQSASVMTVCVHGDTNNVSAIHRGKTILVRTLSDDQESFGEAALWPSSRVVRCFNHRFAPWIRRQQRVDHENVSMTCSTIVW